MSNSFVDLSIDMINFCHVSSIVLHGVKQIGSDPLQCHYVVDSESPDFYSLYAVDCEGLSDSFADSSVDLVHQLRLEAAALAEEYQICFKDFS